MPIADAKLNAAGHQVHHLRLTSGPRLRLLLANLQLVGLELKLKLLEAHPNRKARHQVAAVVEHLRLRHQQEGLEVAAEDGVLGEEAKVAEALVDALAVLPGADLQGVRIQRRGRGGAADDDRLIGVGDVVGGGRVELRRRAQTSEVIVGGELSSGAEASGALLQLLGRLGQRSGQPARVLLLRLGLFRRLPLSFGFCGWCGEVVRLSVLGVTLAVLLLYLRSPFRWLLSFLPPPPWPLVAKVRPCW